MRNLTLQETYFVGGGWTNEDFKEPKDPTKYPTGVQMPSYNPAGVIIPVVTFIADKVVDYVIAKYVKPESSNSGQSSSNGNFQGNTINCPNGTVPYQEPSRQTCVVPKP